MKTLILVPLIAFFATGCTLTTGGTLDSSHIPPSEPAIMTNRAEIQTLLQTAYSEELLAHDLYTQMIAKYPELTEVSNIIRSEDEHRERIGTLLDARQIPRPTDYGTYQSAYTTLLSQIESSLTGAIETGIMIETGDIDHLVAEYQETTDTDIRKVFEEIGGGSFNHLRAFLRLARSYNYMPQTNTEKYLSSTDIDSRGPLHDHMTTLLQSLELPTYSSGIQDHGISGDQRRGRH